MPLPTCPQWNRFGREFSGTCTVVQRREVQVAQGHGSSDVSAGRVDYFHGLAAVSFDGGYFADSRNGWGLKGILGYHPG
jgi:hypothetical protein